MKKIKSNVIGFLFYCGIIAIAATAAFFNWVYTDVA